MLPRLNGLRAIAILLVLLVHGVFFLTSSIIGTGILSVIDGGEMGVCIFFALSGFLITRACLKLKSGEVPVYFRKRVAKILPPFYLSLSLALIFQIWTQAPEPWKQLLEQTANFILFLEPMHPVGPHWYADVYLDPEPGGDVLFYRSVRDPDRGRTAQVGLADRARHDFRWGDLLVRAPAGLSGLPDFASIFISPGEA